MIEPFASGKDWTLYHGDCLEVMATLAGESADMILCDLPYGTTACKWDTIIPFEPLWMHYRRIAKRNAATVLTASQPFTTALIHSNAQEFRYCWVWDKCIPSGFNYARFQPMRQHEDVAVFYREAPAYDSTGEPYAKPITYKPAASPSDSSHMTHTLDRDSRLTATHKRKRSILTFPKVRAGDHPTQKPVALMEYLVRTYTRSGDTVMDNCTGSGTTGVACIKTGRKFVGIELDAGYCEIAARRMREAENHLFAAEVRG